MVRVCLAILHHGSGLPGTGATVTVSAHSLRLLACSQGAVDDSAYARLFAQSKWNNLMAPAKIAQVTTEKLPRADAWITHGIAVGISECIVKHRYRTYAVLAPSRSGCRLLGWGCVTTQAARSRLRPRGVCIPRPPARATFLPRTGRQAQRVLSFAQELAIRRVAPEHVRAALEEVFGPSGTVQLGGEQLDERERGEDFWVVGVVPLP